MKLLFYIIFFPIIIICKLFISLLYIVKGMIYGIFLFPLSLIGIDINSSKK